MAKVVKGTQKCIGEINGTTQNLTDLNLPSYIKLQHKG